MDDKKTIEMLKGMLTKYPLAEEEKDAVLNAIGILSWTKLAEGSLRRMKRSQDRKRSVG